MIDYDGTIPTKSKTEVATSKESPVGGSSGTTTTTGDQSASASKPNKDSENQDKDDVFSDTESEGSVSSKKRHGQMSSSAGNTTTATNDPKTGVAPEEMADVTRRTENVSLGNDGRVQNPTSEVKHDGTGAASSIESSDFKAIAADASVFSFGDDEDYESE